MCDGDCSLVKRQIRNHSLGRTHTFMPQNRLALTGMRVGCSHESSHSLKGSLHLRSLHEDAFLTHLFLWRHGMAWNHKRWQRILSVFSFSPWHVTRKLKNLKQSTCTKMKVTQSTSHMSGYMSGYMAVVTWSQTTHLTRATELNHLETRIPSF